jgi:enoyl-CoA hydratase
MSRPIPNGAQARLDLMVSAEQAIHLGAVSNGPVVFSTPAMINLMEHAAREALSTYLEANEESVGVRVNVEHVSATPIGQTVIAEATVTGVDGRQVDFDVRAFDQTGLIGQGTHRRALVAMDRLTSAVDGKLRGNLTMTRTYAPDSGPLPAFSTLKLDQEGPTLTVTLNRPAKLNTIDTVMTAEIERLLGWLEGHFPAVRVVVFTGAGKAFCAGDDVREVGTLSIPDARSLALRQGRMFLHFEKLPQITIASVNGYALGGGCSLAYSCDLRVASASARFGMPEVLLGWPPAYSNTQLAMIVGKARALEMTLLGEPVSAQRALEIGLVSRVVPDARLSHATDELVEKLLALPMDALRDTKRAFHLNEGMRPQSNVLNDVELYARNLAGVDAREGIAAFVEKRPARFRRA